MKFTPDYSDIPSVKSRANSDNPSTGDDPMDRVNKKNYLAHPVTQTWCDEVKAELDKRGRGAQARLLEHLKKRGVKTSSGHLADILGGKYDTSDIVEPTHEFLGWAPPLPPTASRDAGELVHAFRRLTPQQRAQISEASKQIGELSGDEARDLLALLFASDKRN